jgi:hypothetical protein
MTTTNAETPSTTLEAPEKNSDSENNLAQDEVLVNAKAAIQCLNTVIDAFDNAIPTISDFENGIDVQKTMTGDGEDLRDQTISLRGRIEGFIRNRKAAQRPNHIENTGEPEDRKGRNWL